MGALMVPVGPVVSLESEELVANFDNFASKSVSLACKRLKSKRPKVSPWVSMRDVLLSTSRRKVRISMPLSWIVSFATL